MSNALGESVTDASPGASLPADRDRLPLAGLLALFTAGFLTILTEALPAGLLPQMSRGLGVSESLAGQTVTIYAIGTLLTAIPLTVYTASWPRRNVLVLSLVLFVVANSVTAVSTSFFVTMPARFLAGIAAGIIWSLIGGYAQRLVAPRHSGRAMAISMAGTPLALALGVPIGTFLGGVVGWQATFGIVTVATVILIGWVFWKLPNLSGQAAEKRPPILTVLRLPGLRTVLAVVAGLVIAHNIIYTYIASILDGVGMALQTEWVLFAFGAAALVSIWIVGALIDRHHRRLVVTSMVVFALGALLLGLATLSPVIVYVAAAAWGLAFGGAATLMITSAARVGGDSADVATSMVVTMWNVGIALGGIVGGLLLAGLGSGSLAWVALALMVPTVFIAVTARRYAFPPSSARL